MTKQERLLVKHSVTGRMLLESAEGHAYTFHENGDLTKITVEGVAAETAETIAGLFPELNVFRFEEPAEGPVVKHWYYVGTHPVAYDAASKTLTITVQSEIEYRPDQYWA